jgi:hypothetical protein
MEAMTCIYLSHWHTQSCVDALTFSFFLEKSYLIYTPSPKYSAYMFFLKLNMHHQL